MKTYPLILWSLEMQKTSLAINFPSDNDSSPALTVAVHHYNTHCQNYLAVIWAFANPSASRSYLERVMLGGDSA